MDEESRTKGEGPGKNGETPEAKKEEGPAGDGVPCPNCGKAYTGPPPPTGEILFCPECDAVIPLAPSTPPGGKAAKEKPAARISDPRKETRSLKPPGGSDKEAVVLVCKSCKTRSETVNFKAGEIRFCQKCDSSLSVEKKEISGKVLGGYTIEDEVGRGGMAVVYKAFQKALNRHVAVKVLLAGEGASGDMVVQLHREAQAAAKLKHPNIVTVLDVGVHKGIHYIAMELVVGKPLSAAVGKRRFKGRTAGAIMAKVAKAIHAAHEQGVVHRDIKPSNILLSKGDEPRVMDFGLAKDTGVDGDLMAGGGVGGTPEYMSPEQAGGSKDLDRRTDVFGMGAVLYALLTGKPPFKGGSVEETLQLARGAEPIPPRKLNPSTPADLEAICLKAMAREKEDRYPSAKAMAQDLDRFLAEDVVSAAPPTFLGGLKKMAMRNPVIPAVAAVAVIVLVIGLVVILSTLSGDGKKGGGKGGSEGGAGGRNDKGGKESDWEKGYEEAKEKLLRRIADLKGKVRLQVEKAASEMNQDPERALATLRDANTLMFEVDDRVMKKAPEVYMERLSEDPEVVEAAQGKETMALIARARADAMGARAWRTWESELDLEKARLDFDQAVAVPDCSVTVLAGRGMMFREAGMFKEAVGDFLRAVEKMPALLSSQENLKYVLDAGIRSGRGEEVGDYVASLEEDTGDRAYYSGLMSFVSGDLTGAEKEYAKAIQSNSLHYRALLGFAEILEKKGEFEGAATKLVSVVDQIRGAVLARGKGRTRRDRMLIHMDLIDALLTSAKVKAALSTTAAGAESLRLESEARAEYEEILRVHPWETRARAGLESLGG